MFDRIQRWYNQGLWDIEKVKDAVRKGVITKEQYKEITGEDYA